MVTAATFILQASRKCDFLFISGPGWVHNFGLCQCSFQTKLFIPEEETGASTIQEAVVGWSMKQDWQRSKRQLSDDPPAVCSAAARGKDKHIQHQPPNLNHYFLWGFFCLFWGGGFFLLVSLVAPQTVPRHQLNIPTRIVEKHLMWIKGSHSKSIELKPKRTSVHCWEADTALMITVFIFKTHTRL